MDLNRAVARKLGLPSPEPFCWADNLEDAWTLLLMVAEMPRVTTVTVGKSEHAWTIAVRFDDGTAYNTLSASPPIALARTFVEVSA